MSEPFEDPFALLLAVPLRHLVAGREVCAARGRVALPATARGDLALMAPGDPVYLYAFQMGDHPPPAATWQGRFVRAVDAVSGAYPDGAELVPPSLLEEPTAPGGSGATPEAADDPLAAEDEHDRSPLPGRGPVEVFIEVEALRELDRREWLFTNELVRKQQRGARTFVPAEPVRVRLPD